MKHASVQGHGWETVTPMEWGNGPTGALRPRPLARGPGQWRDLSSPFGSPFPALLVPFPTGQRVPAQPEGVTSRGGAGRLR